MTTIGKFKTQGINEYFGAIATLEFQSTDVRIVPCNGLSSADNPTHRVIVGDIEIGIGWTKSTRKGEKYLHLSLDEPSFNAPILADLTKDTLGDGFTLALVRLATIEGGG